MQSRTNFSLSSCQEARTVLQGFHSRAGEGSDFEVLRGERGLMNLLTQFLLEPPYHVDDRFAQELTGQCIRLADRRRTARCGGNPVNFRCHIAAAGIREVTSGIRKWTVRCTGDCFAIGVIPMTSWFELQKDISMDWPFVGSGFGQGVGLIMRRGNLYVATCPQYPHFHCCDDREVFSKGLELVEEFSVVLDMERAKVYFEADGREIPYSSIEHINCASPYRFIASVPPGRNSITFVEEEITQ